MFFKLIKIMLIVTTEQLTIRLFLYSSSINNELTISSLLFTIFSVNNGLSSIDKILSLNLTSSSLFCLIKSIRLLRTICFI